MGAEKLGYSAVVLLTLGIVLSMIIFASPVSAGGVTSTPGGTTITVVSDQVFLLRHELYFNQASFGGYFAMSINWDVPSSDENFTLENTPSVYWISGPESGLPVENVITSQGATLTGWQITAKILSSDKNYVDGHFNVDIWLRARGGDGTPHSPDNQQLNYGTGILVVEQFPNLVPVDNVTVNVLPLVTRSVDVSISPSYENGLNGFTLTYTVTITNTGNVDDDYSLTVTDYAALSWNPTVSPTPLSVSAGSSENATLSVTVPSNAIGGTIDNIIVTATSQTDDTVSASDSCIAQAIESRNVSVSISPTSKSGADNATLTYTVMVSNTGNVSDNYILTDNDNAGWSPSLSKTSIVVAPFSSDNTTTLSLTIPDNAVGGTIDNIKVTATGTGVSNSKSCTASVTIVRGVNIQVTPTVQENVPHRNVTFTVEILNTSNVIDNFNLTLSDNENWSPTLDENLFENVAPRDNRTTTLRVTIPENAPPGTEDNIAITATSLADNTIKDENNCVVHVAILGVLVTISPGEKSAFPGETATFTVTVRNTGENADNYILYAIDNLSWGLSLADNLIENLAPGLNRTTTLIVSIPENAVPGTSDEITVTATSLENENRIVIATCIASSIAMSRAVDVSISPANTSGMQGSGLSFTVKVKNNGNIADNYDLTVNDNANWNPTISENTLEIPAGENQSVTLTVTVPDNTAPGIMDGITVTATCRENVAVSDSATCLVQALILRGVEVSISPEYSNGPPGAVLDYTVMVANTGRTEENFMIVASGTEGWTTSIFPDSLILEPGQSGEATLSITVPLSASGSSMIFYIWAISSADPMVRGNDTCRAIALELKKEAGSSIPWIQIIKFIIIAAIIAGAVFAVGYLTRRRGRGRMRRNLLGR